MKFINKKHFIALSLQSIFMFYACTSTNTRPLNSTPSQTITSLAPNKPFESNTIDGILATITDQVILLSDLQQAIFIASNGQTKLLPNGLLVGGNMSTQQAYLVLDSLINQTVLRAKTLELGIDIPEDELSQRINEFLKQRGFSEEDLKEQLEKSGKTVEDYRKEFKTEILKQSLIARVITPLVNVSEEEVKSFYIQQTGSIKQISTIKLRSLMIKIPDNEKDDILSSKLVKIVNEKISEKSDFSALVKQYSMASDVEKTGGLLPPKPIHELPEQVRTKLMNINVNDIIGPIVLGSSVFYFQYLGVELTADNEFQKNFNTWKNKLQDIKFNERLSEYLKAERTKLKANIRPIKFTRL
ncbi:SurA N-terminal domain-containing protein [Pigmentibacter sp. JX0631]|uniref:peptidylprolyl isomerase n=1 Tax=Pigmentibacter sp. JX0631 TaxID=2976982 RepID=UPI0024690377|nr:SurA N-terminal domain-containing protein [Pigmentibacter sp. JX0631]WGL61460.1 SurA N-terminal domain-containing protein [Pigmentibacter sp. JX0631]